MVLPRSAKLLVHVTLVRLPSLIAKLPSGPCFFEPPVFLDHQPLRQPLSLSRSLFVLPLFASPSRPQSSQPSVVSALHDASSPAPYLSGLYLVRPPFSPPPLQTPQTPQMVQKQNPVTSGLARRCTIYFWRVPEERSRDDLAPHPPSFELDIVNDQWIKSLKLVAYSPIENYARRKAQSLLDRYRSVAVSPPLPPPHPSPFFTCQATLGSVECVWVT